MGKDPYILVNQLLKSFVLGFKMSQCLPKVIKKNGTKQQILAL